MENGFNLRERTTLIVGPFTSVVQSLVMHLTQLGSDCVLLDTENQSSQRFCSQVSDGREVNPKLGRAIGIKSPLKSFDDMKEAVASAAQLFGSVDLYVDAQVYNRPNQFKIGEAINYMDEVIDQNLKSSMMLSHAVLSYFKNRKRGRILFLANENYPDPLMAASRGALVPFAQNLARQVAEYNITVNVLKLAWTEEYIMALNPEAKTIKEAVEKLKEKDPHMKITEPEKVSHTVSFLVSQFGLSVTGQVINLS
jgi:2-hydroxycyclohexanecarboxyl-CoA dehydrogenase